jgi:hypothetical protein
MLELADRTRRKGWKSVYAPSPAAHKMRLGRRRRSKLSRGGPVEFLRTLVTEPNGLNPDGRDEPETGGAIAESGGRCGPTAD